MEFQVSLHVLPRDAVLVEDPPALPADRAGFLIPQPQFDTRLDEIIQPGDSFRVAFLDQDGGNEGNRSRVNREQTAHDAAPTIHSKVVSHNATAGQGNESHFASHGVHLVLGLVAASSVHQQTCVAPHRTSRFGTGFAAFL
jgi:hypothetical protein